MKYEIIDIVFGSKSFSWANARYIIVNTRSPKLYNPEEIEICRFVNNKPELFDDGSFSVSITGKNNTGITRTGMFYYGEREKKLKRILNIKQ